MLLALNKIKELENYFKNEKELGHIRDYRVMLQLNMRIEVHLLVNSSDDLMRYAEMIKSQNDSIRFREIIYEEDEKYDWLFPTDDKLRENIGPRRRLSNLIDLQDIDLGINCPIATFYSYKGGMGRSTTLAAFASYLAIHCAKKVVIVDCDFEAPGFTNYFDLDLGADNENQKSGIVEYLLDSQFAKLAKNQLDIRKDYAYEVAQPYVEKGSVFIIPAGNLSSQSVSGNGKTHRDHYLESLARIDITSVNEMIAQFKEFISEVYIQLELDEESVILFDSRTGFNDVFSILASISNVIVGFFGINKQTKTGLFQFLDTFGNIENKSIFLTNSLVSSPAEKRVFNAIIQTYFIDNAERFEDPEKGLPKFASKTFSIEYDQKLRYIGVEKIEDDYKESINGSSINTTFIKIIKEKLIFKDLFENIISHLEFLIGKKKKDDEVDSSINKSINLPFISSATNDKVETALSSITETDDFFE